MEEFKYFNNMQDIHSDIYDKISEKLSEVKSVNVTADDVRRTLGKIKNNEALDYFDYYNMLSDASIDFIEELGEISQKLRLQYFGNNVYLFSPLYIANYCENSCKYCGFRAKSDIVRAKLTMNEIESEMKQMRREKIEDVLILTGESQKYSSVDYICDAVKLAKKYFRVVGVEVYPTNVEDYKNLHEAGCDFVTAFQETYNPTNYKFYHPTGHKSCFPYRLDTQERAIMGGIRGVGFGALFGLSDGIEDCFCLGMHANLLQKKYPHAEISISFPRIRPTKNEEDLNIKEVPETKLMQFIIATRIFLPFAQITISTRESNEFRNLSLLMGATKISASVDTGIGRRNDEKDKGDEQFLINDTRTVDQVERDLAKYNLYPVYSDYIDV